MDEMKRHIFRNVNDGCPVAYAAIPDGFRDQTQLLHERKANGGNTYRYSGEVISPDGAIRIFFDSGRGFMDMRMQPGQSGYAEDGTEIHAFCDLRTQMDETAALITGARPQMINFHSYSAQKQGRLQSEFNSEYQKTYRVLTDLLQNQGNVVSMQMGESFLDGGICEYSSGGRSLFISFSRSGYRSVIFENYTGRQMADNIVWTIPWFMYMICEHAQRDAAFDIFRTMAESFEKSRELTEYDERLTQQDVMISNTAFAQNQQMINYAMQQQNAAWNAVERQRNMLSRDLDQFRSGLNQSMQQNDVRRQEMFSHGSPYAGGAAQPESTDDYIGRLRHESMMGVNTYVNEEGHETEFTTQADRVFESRLDGLDHFGTANYYDDYVPDGFDELRRK